jgi:hypothetical protein
MACSRFNISASTCGVVWGPAESSSIAKVIGTMRQDEDLQQTWASLEPLHASKDPLHVLFLKGSQGRPAILSYLIVPTGTAITSLLRFREHFRTKSSEPSVIGRLRAITPPSGKAKDKESRQIVDGMTRVRTIEAMLQGEPVPSEVYARIIHALSPSNLTDADRGSSKAARKGAYYAALCQLSWFEYVLAYDGKFKRRYRDMDSTEEPKIEQYVITRAPGAERMDEYIIGRLIALEEAIRYEAHRRHVGGASSMPLATVNPAVWYQDHFRRMRTYDEKLSRRGIRGTMLTKQAREVTVELQSIGTIKQTAPFTPAGRSSLGLGYVHQDAFIKAHRRWSYDSRKAKRAKEVEAAE